MPSVALATSAARDCRRLWAKRSPLDRPAGAEYFAGEAITLGDALEDAGCDSADILAHCRGLGPHVRGCGVVDLILDRA